MDNIGAEVNQKMRSAIKAKLMELGCYVDDELPDYVMVMVANKRSKSQMNEDLQLFLTNKTQPFVEWLQIVLKKLKEVTVTNPDIYKHSFVPDSLKRKSTAASDIPIKREKKDKEASKKTKPNSTSCILKKPNQITGGSLTDDLPMVATNLAEKRLQNSKIISDKQNVDSFDIPSLSEVKNLDESDLTSLEKRIQSVRKRVVMMNSESEDEDFINIKAETEELFEPDNLSNQDILSKSRNITIVNDKKSDTVDRAATKNARKIKLVRKFSSEESTCNEAPENRLFGKNSGRKQCIESVETEKLNDVHLSKKSVMHRLGKKDDDTLGRLVHIEENLRAKVSKQKINLSEALREERELLGISDKQKTMDDVNEKSRKPRISVLKRLGIKSTIAKPIYRKPDSEIVEEPKSVPSVIKIKSRVMIPIEKQANKNLLLKAVAEAQKSIVQTNINESQKKKKLINDGLHTKKYKEKLQIIQESEKNENKTLPTYDKNANKRLANTEISKLKNFVIQISTNDNKQTHLEKDHKSNLEYIPKSVAEEQVSDDQNYVPSSIDLNYDEFDAYDFNSSEHSAAEEPINQQRFIVTLDGVLDNRNKTNITNNESADYNSNKHSPIVYNTSESNNHLENNKNPIVPSTLPKVHSAPSLKIKEKCKFYPGCRLGDKCEYVHPVTNCKMFPQCKFGDKCLYIHPLCKFDASCTRRDCPYSHGSAKTLPSVPRTTTVMSSQSFQTCKYFPNCTNTHCTFYHPKPCKFGKFCTKDDCNFVHEHRGRGNLTWQRT